MRKSKRSKARRGSARSSARPRQLLLEERMHGGWRPGAGRPKSKGSGVAHTPREPLAARFPVHVTVKVQKGLPSMRRKKAYRVLRKAFEASQHRAGSAGVGFRLVHYSVQTNHLHLLVEASDRISLSRGMQGMLVRVARGLNRLWERTGRLVADRYHDRILRTPREVRNALGYVLHNTSHHGHHFSGPDPYSSGESFDGWRDYRTKVTQQPEAPPPDPVTRARTWLLEKGWRRHHLIPLHARTT